MASVCFRRVGRKKSILTSAKLVSPTHLICWQSLHHALRFLVAVYSEPLFLRHTGQLHVLAVQLLLHDLFQRLQY